jgi:hypothetical protein
MNKSVHINCYDKHYQLKQEYPDTPYIDNSLNIIRFEIQCKYLKTQYMQRQIKDCDDFKEKMVVMVSDEFCTSLLKSYYYKIIGSGDYYTLDGARDKVKSLKFCQSKEKRLLHDLESVNKHRGVYKAKTSLSGHELTDFKRSLMDLNELGVNPVTIPRELRIKFLPNLMKVYLKQREEQETAWEEYRIKCLNDHR